MSRFAVKQFLVTFVLVSVMALIFACTAAQKRLVFDATQGGLEKCALEAPSTDVDEVVKICHFASEVLPWLRPFLASKATGIQRYSLRRMSPDAGLPDAGTP